MNEWILRLITLVVNSASPELRKIIKEWVLELEKRAKETPNPFDDVLVGLIKIVLNIKNDD